MKINRTCCNALIGTEQEQINQLYEFVKALAGNYFEGFEIMGTYSPTVNYNKKYMLVFFEGSTYVKTVDGDSVNYSPALNPDKWALFSSGTPADLSDLEKVIEGSDTVVVDVNEAGTALEIHADYENVVRPLERALKKPVSNPTETVLAGVDAQGEQVLLPVSSVGGGTKLYLHYLELGATSGVAHVYFYATRRLNITTGYPTADKGLDLYISYPKDYGIISPIYLEITSEDNPALSGIILSSFIATASFMCLDLINPTGVTAAQVYEYSVTSFINTYEEIRVVNITEV